MSMIMFLYKDRSSRDACENTKTLGFYSENPGFYFKNPVFYIKSTVFYLKKKMVLFQVKMYLLLKEGKRWAGQFQFKNLFCCCDNCIAAE